jgi:transcription elongation factor Elf1
LSWWRIRLGTYLLGRDLDAGQASAAETVHAKTRRPGVDCPRCGTLITVNIDDLLSGSSTVCPNESCGLRLEVDCEKSRETLDALREYADTIRTFQEPTESSLSYPRADIKWQAMPIAKRRRQP